MSWVTRSYSKVVETDVQILIIKMSQEKEAIETVLTPSLYDLFRGSGDLRVYQKIF